MQADKLILPLELMHTNPMVQLTTKYFLCIEQFLAF